MKTILKYAAAAALTGALALAAASPSEARNGRNTAAAIGFGAGALFGAAVMGSQYNDGYYYGPGYYDDYAYAPGYAYEPAYGAHYAPRPYYGPRYYRSGGTSCGGSPGSINYNPCNN